MNIITLWYGVTDITAVQDGVEVIREENNPDKVAEAALSDYYISMVWLWEF